MNRIRAITSAAVIAATMAAVDFAQAQGPGLGRTDVLRHDISVPGREVIQVLVDFQPGAVSPRHSHPGEEIAYVIQGTLEYEIEGRPNVVLKAGDALFIPAGANHLARNVGAGKAVELATYLVHKGRPLLKIAD